MMNRKFDSNRFLIALKLSTLFFSLLTLCLIISSCFLPFYYEKEADISLDVLYYLNDIRVVVNNVNYPLTYADSELINTHAVFQVNHVFLVISSILSAIAVSLTLLKFYSPFFLQANTLFQANSIILYCMHTIFHFPSHRHAQQVSNSFQKGCGGIDR